MCVPSFPLNKDLLDPGVAIEGIKIQYDDKTKNYNDQSPIRIARFYGNRLGAVSYTFDDGLLEQYTELFPVMKRLGLKGSFCVNGRTINNAKPTDERDAISLDIKDKGKVIEVMPSLSLDSKIFVMPLSLIVPKSVRKVMQDGKQLKLKLQNGEKYVDMNPFGGKIVLTK